MRPLARLLTAAALVFATGPAMAAPADSPVNVPEPEGFHTGPQQGYTPTLKGAAVLDIDGLDRLVAADKPMFIDVALADRRPAGMAADKPWLPAHRSIPGAVWMPSSGAALDPAHEALFLKRVAELTGGDKARPIVTFCHPDCWGSWNAGKRLVQQGYTRVHWFPTGIEGWQDRHETTVIAQDAAWAARPAAEAQR